MVADARSRTRCCRCAIVLDRNRGGAYLAMLIAGAGMFGVFLFLTYYLQPTLRLLARSRPAWRSCR